MPLLETKGAASAQGFGGAGAGASGPVTYIEDVFSTYLYTGNGSTQTITNGIDLSGKGGLVWVKGRGSTFAYGHCLFDTARGAEILLNTNNTNANSTDVGTLTAFNSNGFSLGSRAPVNYSGDPFVSWTFRKQPKFFDIVTYTGNGSVPRSIAHNLGSVPGFIAIKLTSGADNWICRHRSTGDTPNDMTNYVANDRLFLNTTGAAGSSSNIKADATTFTVNHTGDLNVNGATYVAYLFAHNAGGFGLTGTDNVISCGSFTTDGVGMYSVNLGYEPQWVLMKRSDSSVAGNWTITDNMRGMTSTGTGRILNPNTSNAESDLQICQPNATGFSVNNGTNLQPGATYIYIAIRRGPMKVPTSGTSVFSPAVYTGNGVSQTITTNFVVDAVLNERRNSPEGRLHDRMRGDKGLLTVYTNAEATNFSVNLTNSAGLTWAAGKSANNAYYLEGNDVNVSAVAYVSYAFRRAPGFFDVVCYTGNSVDPRAITHNLTVAPELLIVKNRTLGTLWMVGTTFTASNCKELELNSTSQAFTYAYTNQFKAQPTSTTFTVANTTILNNSGSNYVAYLFATCAGVSKVGSYTGTGALQTINCGFTGGARFVLIKRTDSTGDWYVYDSARGISSGNDPYLFLNSTAAEVTGTNYVDTTSVGFQVTAAAPAGLNASGGSFVFLAIA